MSFENRFKSALKEMISKSHDDYVELQYSDELYVQVWSHDNGKGSFELYVMVPHDMVDTELVNRQSSSQLPHEIENVESFYEDVQNYVEDVTGNEYPNLAFYKIEVVDDGTWERDATVYATHELNA